jgi:hypothetical protein
MLQVDVRFGCVHSLGAALIPPYRCEIHLGWAVRVFQPGTLNVEPLNPSDYISNNTQDLTCFQRLVLKKQFS